MPFLKKSLAGEYLATALAPSGETHAVRLVGWLHGTPLAEVPRTFELMRSLGQSFDEIDRALQGFIHPGAVRDLDWDLRHAARSRSRLHFVKDADKRAILERFIERLRTKPSNRSLRVCVRKSYTTTAMTGTSSSTPQSSERLGRHRFRRCRPYDPDCRSSHHLRLFHPRHGRPDRRGRCPHCRFP